MTLCRVLGVPRSTASYASKPSFPLDLSALKHQILTLLVTYSGFGVRRMFALLTRLRVRVSRGQVRRAYVGSGS
jgi:hypothetical protein